MLNNRISRRSFLTISAMTAASFALDWKKIVAYAAGMGPQGNYPTVIIGSGLEVYVAELIFHDSAYQ